jgi:hypothetical protein
MRADLLVDLLADLIADTPAAALLRAVHELVVVAEEIVALRAPPPPRLLGVVPLVVVAWRRRGRVEWQLGAELHPAVAAPFQPENGSGRRSAAAAVRT